MRSNLVLGVDADGLQQDQLDRITAQFRTGARLAGKLSVLGTSPLSVHQALLFRQLSDDVTLFVHTMPDPGEPSARHR